MKTDQTSHPWFMRDPGTLFLAVGTGDVYITDIVRAEHLVRTWVEWAECGNFNEIEPDRLEEITAMIANLDYWTQDGDLGPCEFSESFGETGRLSFYLLDGFACVGAIPSRPDVDDGAPDCPLMHILHPANAGCTPTLLYGRLPKHQRKLAHT